jgi:predicted small lipoprotein YifL
MRTPSRPYRTDTLLFALAFASVVGVPLGGCGQKGALYHPDPADAPAAPATTPDDPAKKKDETKHDGAPR